MRVKVAVVFIIVCRLLLCRFPVTVLPPALIVSSITSPVSAFTTIPSETRRFGFWMRGLTMDDSASGLNVTRCRA